ncbi:hypothetical protein MBM_09908 [Drepanopeziza brunnea f. sp. 'multigermtubi' MB_m1]|uniref:3CxxC-type domain-containing protein n=2 Tax=Drepanopeziza brunnea f. sp. 'multigermtubi' TaxID=698441 RepID=K1WTM2_MARBU|nr:uncharacterized protein MBM_09908 [Drepanopeziza brunnea f. sp. 'multigermtubi' MB_m1]EKD11938.1 hypothetical protein MBM_09908 [Drepanopeziza brunnea f. sp. 'multigermtubi' MB_m1]
MTRRQQQQKPQRRKAPPAWSMFLSRHDDVSRLLEVEGHPFTFHNLDDELGCSKTYDTTVMGKFHCRNRNCESKIWASKRVAITIRMYPGKRYNARVYGQRCKKCDWLSVPTLDDSYAERVAYRLLKWSGVEQERPQFSGESTIPHRSDLCEGCRAGHCAEGDRVNGVLAAQFSNFSLRGT